jgi:hypothetical protein
MGAWICSISALAQAEDCVTRMPDLVKMIDGYSRSTGTKFVLDPRVRARVTLVGVEGSDLDYEMLVSVLHMHGFTALEAAGIVYVVPEKVAPSMRRKLGLE